MGILEPRLLGLYTDGLAPGGLLGRLAPSLLYDGGMRAPAVLSGWPREPLPDDTTALLPGRAEPPPAERSLAAAGTWLGNNSATLLGLGAGIAGGSSWGDALGKGLRNAMTGRALDGERGARNELVAALMRRGLDEGTARAAAGHPAMLKAVLWQLYRPAQRGAAGVEA